MITQRDVFLKRKIEQDKKADKRGRYRAVLTDAEGNQTSTDPQTDVWANQTTRRVWHMPLGATQPSQVFCQNISNPYVGLPVECGYEESNNTIEVLRVDQLPAKYGESPIGWDQNDPASFEPGGLKMMWLYSKALIPLATWPDATGLVVNINAGDYPYSGSRKTFTGQTGYTLTEPAGAGTHYYAGLYLDAANALQVVYGAAVATSSTPPEPSWPAGAFRLSVVRIANGQTSIEFGSDSSADNDVSDRRMLWSDEQSGTDAIPESIIDAKGDLIAGTAADTAGILPVSGNDGWVLTEDSGEATGMKWAAASGGSEVDNIFINGGFDVWQRTTNDTAVSTTRKYVADLWHVVTGSGTLTNVQRSTTVRGGALSKYSLEMVGTAGVGAVEIGQRIWNDTSAKYKRTVDFSCYIYNGSGAAFTPKLYARTPSAANDWTTNTAQNGGGFGEDLQSCPDAAWTKVTWSADVSGYTDIDNGFGVTIQIPSGSLVAGDTVRFAEFNLTPTSGTFPDMKLTSFDEQYPLCLPYAYVPDASNNAADIGPGAKSGTASINIIIQFPVQMRIAPTLTHNITGYTAGAPGTTTVASVNYSAGVFFAITGSLTVSLTTANKNYGTIRLLAGTSWDGTTGDIATLRLGPSVVAVLAPSVTIF